MYKLIYKGIFSIPEADDVCLITLTDEGEKRALYIVLEKEVANEIKMHEKMMEDVDCQLVDVDCQLVDVFSKVLKDEGAVHYRIVFEGILNQGLKAKLVNTITDASYDIRPEMAVLLSLKSDFEMCTSLDVLQKFSTPYNKNVMSVALPIMSLPDSLLHKALEKAVEEENYEGASFIRDEMKRRSGKTKNK